MKEIANSCMAAIQCHTGSECKRNWMSNRSEIHGERTLKNELDLNNNILMLPTCEAQENTQQSQCREGFTWEGTWTKREFMGFGAQGYKRVARVLYFCWECLPRSPPPATRCEGFLGRSNPFPARRIEEVFVPLQSNVLRKTFGLQSRNLKGQLRCLSSEPVRYSEITSSIL